MGERGEMESGQTAAAESGDAGSAHAGIDRAASGRLMPALLGFIAGAVFWHLVGFWSLVSNMVFSGPREKTAVLSVSTSPSISGVPNEPGRAATALGPNRAGIVTHSVTAGGGAGSDGTRNGLSTANCTTLSQDQPGGPIKRVPCPVDGQSPIDSVVSDGFIDDLVGDWVSGYPNVRVRRPALAAGKRDRDAITTGSVRPRNQRATSEPKVRGWATSLDVAGDRRGR